MMRAESPARTRIRAAGRSAAFASFLLLFIAAPPAALAWNWDGAAWADYRPYLGTINAATKSRLQVIAAAGAAEGRVLGRLGQIGDSITESSAYFRNAVTDGVTSNGTGHDYAPIRSWLSYSGTQPADANSFYRNSGKGIPYGNRGAWTLANAVTAGHPEAGVEVGDGTVPGDFGWALVMFGTNDIDAGNWNATTWKQSVRVFLQSYIDLGVVPVVSTIPPEQAHVGDGRVQAANAALLALAAEMQLPSVDYYGLTLHFQPTTWLGTLISLDGTHPTSATAGQGFSLIAQSATDGYALRTKLTFDMAEKLRAIVFENGPPDGAATSVASGATFPTGAMTLWPSPTRGAAAIRYSLGRESRATFELFDAAGRRLRSWTRGTESAGPHELQWNGADESGRPVSSGVYFVTMTSAEESRTARVVVVR